MNALALLATVTGVSIAAAALMLRVDEPKSPANTLDALVESSKDAHSDEKNKKGDSMTATKEKKISVSRAGFDLTHLSQDKINTLAARLSTEESRVLLGKGTERAFCGNLLDNKLKGAYCANCAACRCLRATPNLTVAQAGLHSFSPLTKTTSHITKTPRWEWSASRSIAPVAADTSATSLTMARAPLACATA